MSTVKRVFFLLLAVFFILAAVEKAIEKLFFVPQNFMREHEMFFRNQWMLSHSEGKIYPIVYNPYYRYDELLGWDTFPGAVHKGDIEVNINSKGVRSGREYSYERKPAKKRIIFLGDSYAFGEDNNNNETTSYYLEESLKNTEFINLGVGGYGHDQMCLKLKEEGLKYDPDVILLLYMPIDNIRNTMEFRDYAKPRFKLEEGKLILTNVPVPSPESMARAKKKHLRTLQLIRYLADSLLENRDRVNKLTGTIIGEMNTLALQNRKKFIVLTLYQNDVTKKLEENGIEIWALNPDEEINGGFIGHWRPEGHRICAGFIREKLSDIGFD